MKIKIFTLSLLLYLTACSPEDFLNVQPETFMTPEQFFSSEHHMELAANTLYGRVQQMHRTLQWGFGEYRSDNTSFQYNGEVRGREDFEYIDEFIMVADNPYIYDYWNQSYNGIMRSNYMLVHMDEVEFSEESVKNTRIGEAKFFRAFHYFNLVRLYGDVPIVLEPIISAEESAEPRRQPADQVYEEVIIPDVLDAIEKLPVDYPAGQVGRVTQGAARTLLAKVYLTRGNFSDVIPQLEAVTQLDYTLLPNYEQLFNPANKNHRESIFEIQYLGNDTQGEHSSFMSGSTSTNLGFAPFNSGTQVIGAGVEGFGGVGAVAGRNQPTRDMIEAYEQGDLRKEISMKESFEDDAGEVIQEPYVNKFNYPMVEPGQEDANWPVYRYADVLLMLAECLNEQGFPSGQAFELLNQVRARAGLPAKTQGHADPDLRIGSQEAFREAVWHERRIELAFENHRWFDLVRTGRAEEVMKAHGEREKDLKTTVDRNAYENIRTLLAIPAVEVNAFGYEQNPGW